MSDIIRYRGETRVIQRTIQNEAGAVLNIAGWSVVLTVNREENPTDSDEEIMRLTGVVTDAPNGVCEFYPEPADVDYVGRFYYDIWAVDAVTKESLMIKGQFIFLERIYKPGGVVLLPDITWVPTGTDGTEFPSGGDFQMAWEEDEPNPWIYQDHDGKTTITPSTLGTGGQHATLKPKYGGAVPHVLRPGQGLRLLTWMEQDLTFRFRLLGITGVLFEAGGWLAGVRFNDSDEMEYEIEAEYSIEDKRIEDSDSNLESGQTAGWFYVLLMNGVEDENDPGEFYHGIKWWPEADPEPDWDSGSNDIVMSGDGIVDPWIWWIAHQGLPFTDHKWRIAEIKVIRSGFTLAL